MKPSKTAVATGLDRINGLLAWWDLPRLIGVSGMEAQAERFGLVLDLNKLFNEACSSQAHALSAANEQFAQALQRLLSVREPPELMAAQLSLVTTLTESFAAQTKVWAELTQKLYSCCSAVTREATTEACEPINRSEPLGKRLETEPADPRPEPKANRQSKQLDQVHG